jgi:hypothetical protein
MAERSDYRRRIAVALVALVASAATIATSATPNSIDLNESTDATVVLDAGAPRAVGRFVLTLSPEALPVATDTAAAPWGTVIFSVGSPNGGGEAGGPVELSVSAVDIPEPSQVESGSQSWPIEQLCRPAEPCRRAFDVTVEWLQPQPGGSVTAFVRASVHLTYMQRLELPTGATATWNADEFATIAPAPALTAQADLGGVTLGRETPWAARHLLVRGSAAILNAPDADVTSFLRWEPSGEDRPPVIVTLVPDDSATPVPSDAGAIIAPLAGCPPATECARGFTAIARWAQLGPDEQVQLNWSYGALARFPGGAGIPVGASLKVEVDNTIDLGPTSPRLRGQANGSFELQPDGSRRYGELKLGVTAFDLGGDAFLGQPPPAVAVVRLRATLKNRGTPAGLTAGHMVHDARGEPLQIADDGSEARAVVFPFGNCQGLGPCTGTIEFWVSSSTGSEATISWDVTVDLPVPRAAQAGGRFQVEVINGP